MFGCTPTCSWVASMTAPSTGHTQRQALGVHIGVVVLNTLIDACCRVGDMARAGELLDDMARGQRFRRVGPFLHPKNETSLPVKVPGAFFLFRSAEVGVASSLLQLPPPRQKSTPKESRRPQPCRASQARLDIVPDLITYSTLIKGRACNKCWCVKIHSKGSTHHSKGDHVKGFAATCQDHASPRKASASCTQGINEGPRFSNFQFKASE